VKSLGSGRRSNEEIASKYDKAWLDQIRDLDTLLKVGFALYDLKRYDEAQAVFAKMQERAGGNQYEQAVALIWQGHMLDLLGRRAEAISRYRMAAGMSVEGRTSHDQFGLVYSPNSYARRRMDAPFARLENLFQD
jgi:tetratricopeptide (TPR) repeat protein